MEESLWILLAPFAWFLFAKVWLRHTFDYRELGVSMVVVFILVTATVMLGKYGATRDVEIWNGTVTKKEVVDGYYQTSYCCATDKDGNCTSTCYTDHYTRSYDGHSTVGSWTFDSIDTEWRSRRDSFGPPASYKACKVGEPASIEHGYTNYVRAVPESLFHDDSQTSTYAAQVPGYPRVHSFYKLNRVINLAGVDSATVNEIDNGLDEALKTLGARKQANIIVILTGINDPTYRYAVERAWLGGKKNDIVIFVGTDKSKSIKWVDVMTWALNSGNELFHVTLRDGILAQKQLDSAQFVPFVTQTVTKLYDRPHMRDYEYLKDEISPPLWVIVTAIILSLIASAGLTYYFHTHELGSSSYSRGYTFRRRRF